MAPTPRGIYENDVDFVELAKQDPDFAKRYISTSLPVPDGKYAPQICS